MLSRDFIFWEVDMQRDFVLPGGNLYVPGAEKLLPNIRRLTDAARRNEVFLVSSGDFHPPNDPEFQQFPPHCLKGQSGSELVPEALADRVAQVENTPAAKLPEHFDNYQQILLEKQTLDVFQTRHADALVERLGLLERKRKVTIVRDAIETLDPKVGNNTIAELQTLGARLVTTEEALANLRNPS